MAGQVQVRRPAPSSARRRFLINDKGYVPLEDVRLGVKGVVFPMSGDVGVLMVVGAAKPGDDYESGPRVQRTLNPAGMTILNAATWETAGIRCVIGHPDDASWISGLQVSDKPFAMPRLGPYRGNREPGFFDWACLRSPPRSGGMPGSPVL